MGLHFWHITFFSFLSLFHTLKKGYRTSEPRASSMESLQIVFSICSWTGLEIVSAWGELSDPHNKKTIPLGNVGDNGRSPHKPARIPDWSTSITAQHSAMLMSRATSYFIACQTHRRGHAATQWKVLQNPPTADARINSEEQWTNVCVREREQTSWCRLGWGQHNTCTWTKSECHYIIMTAWICFCEDCRSLLPHSPTFTFITFYTARMK